MTKAHVLLVDDETEFAETLAERLSLRGYPTQTSSEGEQALDILDQEEPEVLVLDMMMPGMGGLEVLKRLRKSHPDLPVILVTGRGSTRDGIEGMNLGCFDYLSKPLDIEELAAKIDEALAWRKEKAKET